MKHHILLSWHSLRRIKAGWLYRHCWGGQLGPFFLNYEFHEFYEFIKNRRLRRLHGLNIRKYDIKRDFQQIRKSCPPPSYYTPIAVIGELVNQQGGHVTIINPPFEQAPRQKRWWKRSFRFMKGRFYITFSNCRVKKRPTSGDHECSQKLTDNMRKIKEYRYKQQKGLCPECGQPFDIKEMELHHVLPWARFPELRARKANMILLCHKCHKEIHCNPWKNIEMMKAKAEELGIDLKERYDYDEGIQKAEG